MSGKSFKIFYKYDSSKLMGDMIDIESLDLFKELHINNNENKKDYDDKNTDITIDLNTKSKEVKKKKEPKEKGSKGFLTKLKGFPGMKGRRMFTQMCILAGCDYSESISGIGLMHAQLKVIKYKDVDCNDRFKSICDHVGLTKTVDEGYLDRINKAEQLFHYHVVYDPFKRCVLNFMNPLLMNPLLMNSITPSSTVSSLSPPPSLPIITDDELTNIGTEKSLLINAPIDITIDNICEGIHSRQDYSILKGMYPWEHSDIIIKGVVLSFNLFIIYLVAIIKYCYLYIYLFYYLYLIMNLLSIGTNRSNLMHTLSGIISIYLSISINLSLSNYLSHPDITMYLSISLPI
jgi:hypothetical protein